MPLPRALPGANPTAEAELDAEALVHQVRTRRPRPRRNAIATVATVVVVCGFLFALRGPLGLGGSGTVSSGSAAAADFHTAGPTVWKFGEVNGGSNFPGDPPTSSITCAGTATGACYVVIEGNGVNPDGTLVDPQGTLLFAPLLSTEYRSTDRGRTWTKLTLPSGALVTTPFSCSGAESCAAGAVIHATDRSNPFNTGVAALLVTNNAGRTWTVRPLPGPASEVTHLACPTASHCVALTWPSTLAAINGVQPVANDSAYFPTTVMTTSDGGSKWSAALLPAVAADVHYQLGTLTCPTSTLCLATGQRALIENQGGGYTEGDVKYLQLASTDGGRSWTAASLLGPYNSIACVAGSMDCLQVGLAPNPEPPPVWASTNGGRSWKKITSTGIPGSLAQGGITGFTCPSTQDCVMGMSSDFVTTSDGGHTWAFAPAPGAPPLTHPNLQIAPVNVSSVSCLGAHGCFGTVEIWAGPASTAKVVTNQG